MSLTDELNRLRQTDPDVAFVLDTFHETEQVYQRAREAMGRTPRTTASARSSAHVTLSVQPSATQRGRLLSKK